MVNASYLLAPWADVLYAADYRFWVTYWPEISTVFEGECWTVSEQARERFDLCWIRHESGSGFHPDADTIYGGGNSGYQAVHLAATWGAKRIILLGFDMQQTGGKEHFFGKHRGGLPNGTGFDRWRKNFEHLARDLKARRVDVVNCTRETALTCFDRRSLEDVL